MTMYREWAKNDYGLIRFEDFLSRVLEGILNNELDTCFHAKDGITSYDEQLSRC